MSDPFVGEIRMFAGNFAPYGWAFCDGQLLRISDFETLYSLVGTMYGGDGQSTFALPDLRGRLPLGGGGSYPLAQSAGLENVTLTASQIPAHTHPIARQNGDATTSLPAGNLPATCPTATPYGSPTASTYLHAAATANTGGNQPHSNMQPYLCVSFIISLYGIYPTQS